MVPYIKKYDHVHSIYGRTDDNWPVLRFADVLLMLAETINEQSGPTSEAFGYLNQVRQRAGLPAHGFLPTPARCLKNVGSEVRNRQESRP